MLFASVGLLWVSSAFDFSSCVFCKILLSVNDLNPNKLICLGKVSITFIVCLILLMFLDGLIGIVSSGPLLIIDG